MSFYKKVEPFIPIIIAVLTFLWYRRGRLWKFYWSFLYEAKEQILNSSIDRIAWEKIEDKQIQTLIGDIFGCLFYFEMDFLRHLAGKITNEFWIPDSEDSVKLKSDNKNTQLYENKTIEYDNKEKYCEYVFLKILYNHFFLCGLWLFIHSILFSLTKLIKNEKGFKRKITKNKVSKCNNNVRNLQNT